MIRQELLKKLSKKKQKEVLDKKGHKRVYIHSDHGFWRPEAKGYTDKKEEAWQLTLNEAYAATEHCGPEKRVYYPYVTEGQVDVEPLSCDDPAIKIPDVTIKLAEYGD